MKIAHMRLFLKKLPNEKHCTYYVTVGLSIHASFSDLDTRGWYLPVTLVESQWTWQDVSIPVATDNPLWYTIDNPSYASKCMRFILQEDNTYHMHIIPCIIADGSLKSYQLCLKYKIV